MDGWMDGVREMMRYEEDEMYDGRKDLVDA